MKLLDRLERKLGRFAVPNVTLALIFGQVFVYLLELAQPRYIAKLAFIPSLVLQGDLWRVVTFVFESPATNPIFAFFFWYLFYLMGTALEQAWGVFRYNVYLLLGYVATVAVAFVVPDVPASIAFLEGSVFLAFAYLYPDFQISLMFLLPIRIKWLAMLTWGFYCLTILSGNLLAALLATASVVNFFVFFGRDILSRMRAGHRRMRSQASRITPQDKPRHRCAICGITNFTHPDMDFRYCSKCHRTPCYCEEHLRNHQHVEENDG